ncbi:MAG: DNA-directed RNA polymerase subunit P [Candidatus Aenigmatarchaeota archaeon]
MYKCLKCGKDIKFKQIKEKIRCPYCGYRVITKQRSKTIKKVEAI